MFQALSVSCLPGILKFIGANLRCSPFKCLNSTGYANPVCSLYDRSPFKKGFASHRHSHRTEEQTWSGTEMIHHFWPMSLWCLTPCHPPSCSPPHSHCNKHNTVKWSVIARYTHLMTQQAWRKWNALKVGRIDILFLSEVCSSWVFIHCPVQVLGNDLWWP